MKPPEPPPAPFVAPAPKPARWSPVRAPAPHFSRIVLSEAAPPGLSGMDRAPDGTLWAVPERRRELVALSVAGEAAEVRATVPIEGVPRGVDLESMAWVDADTVAFGLERRESGRARDQVLIAKRAGDRFEVQEELSFDYSQFGLRAEGNHGLEALGAAGDKLIAMSETVGEDRRGRYAPLGIYDRSTERWRYARLGLTSETGKISALACRPGRRGIVCAAVERHHEVSRLLRFVLPRGRGGPVRIQPEVVADLADAFPEGHDKLPNFEGLTWLDDKRLMLVSDNDYGVIAGPAELLQVKLP